MSGYLSSGLVAELLNVHFHRIAYITRDRQVRPGKGPTGAFCWSFKDVAAAARILQVPSPKIEDFEGAVTAGVTR